MRVSGIDQTNAIEAWGGAATVIGLGDLTTALDRGTVDGAFSSLSIVHVFHFNEIVDYVTALPTFEPAHCFFMTLDQWNALNEAQQNAIIEGFKDADKNIYEASMAEEYEPYIAEYKESGCDVVELTAEEFKAFTDLLRPNFEALKENNTEEGLEILRIVYEYNGWEF
jgi:TRAP-type C4-dicarboxylate transport system substrate-binding protein